MTISTIVECEDCGKKYRIRYGLGNNYPQLASFQCAVCSKQIDIGYKIKFGPRTLNGAKALTETDLKEEEIEVINLHPEIPTAKGLENNPFYFQTTEVFRNINMHKTDFKQFREQQIRWSKFHSKWGEIEKPLRILATKGDSSLKTICGLSYKEFNNLFNKWIDVFIEGKLEASYEEICDQYNSIDTEKIKEYVRKEPKFLNQVYDFCCTYMKYHEQFQSTIFHMKNGWDIPNDVIANINWDEIHKVYGDLYEIIGDLFVIPTMFNNVAKGRDYDQFQKEDFTIKKYLHTDKAHRAANFDSNPKLAFLAESYHSWLRNGTHHKNSSLNTETFEVSLGTSKGGTVEKKIKIIEYISKCNELFGMGLIISSLILSMKK